MFPGSSLSVFCMVWARSMGCGKSRNSYAVLIPFVIVKWSLVFPIGLWVAWGQEAHLYPLLKVYCPAESTHSRNTCWMSPWTMSSHSELLWTPGKAENPGTVATCAPLTAPTHPPSLCQAAVGAEGRLWAHRPWVHCGGASVQSFLLRGLLKSQGTCSGEPPEQGWKDRIPGKSLTHRFAPCECSCGPCPPTYQGRRGGERRNPLHAGAWERGETFSQLRFLCASSGPGSLFAGCTVNTCGRQHSSFNHCRIGHNLETLNTYRRAPVSWQRKRIHVGGPTARKGKLTRANRAMLSKESWRRRSQWEEKQREPLKRTQKTFWRYKTMISQVNSWVD